MERRAGGSCARSSPPASTLIRSFDLDENESLDASEIQAACAAAGIPITDRNLQKAMKLLDKNEDGVIDLSEFKGIAIMGHKRALPPRRTPNSRGTARGAASSPRSDKSNEGCRPALAPFYEQPRHSALAPL